MKKVDIEIAWQ